MWRHVVKGLYTVHNRDIDESCGNRQVMRHSYADEQVIIILLRECWNSWFVFSLRNMEPCKTVLKCKSAMSDNGRRSRLVT
jgi:hypothetical protein